MKLVDVEALLAETPAEPHTATPVPPPTESGVRVSAARTNDPRRKSAAATNLALAWPVGGDGNADRHNAQFHLAGALAHDGWPEAEALDFVCEVCREAGNEERTKREKTIRETYRKLAEGKEVTGWTRLEGLIDRGILDGVRALLRPYEKPWKLGAEKTGDAFVASVTSDPASKWTTARDRALRIGGLSRRLKTGFTALDTATRGGIPLAKAVVIGGAPGAGKTATGIQWAHRWLSEGVHVGILASDEDPDALLTRFGQLNGLSRADLESGDADARKNLADWVDSVPLLLVDGDEDEATVEQVSAELARRCNGEPSVMFLDSLQTVRVAKSKGDDVRAHLNEVMRVVKRCAKVNGHLVIATSELSRGAYRNQDSAENIEPLSAFKESGDIEYGAGLAFVLRSVKGHHDLVDAAVVKNRFGGQKPSFRLRLHEAQARIAELGDADRRALDPYRGMKEQVKKVLNERGNVPVKKTFLKETLLKGNNDTKTQAIRQMLDDGELAEVQDGVRIPIPGDPGYAE